MCPKPFSQIFPKECFSFWLMPCLDPSRRKRMQHHTHFKTGLKIIATISFCGTSVILLCHVEVWFRSNHWFVSVVQPSWYTPCILFVHDQDGELGSGFTHAGTEIQWLILLHLKVTDPCSYYTCLHILSGMHLKLRVHATAGKYFSISSLETRVYSYLGMSAHTILNEEC